MSHAKVSAMRRLPRRKVLAWAGLSVLGAPACLSPTIPLPPPEVPDTLQVGEGRYKLRGALPFVARVIVRNERTSLIVGLENVLLYELEVLAEATDTMILWYETDVDISSPAIFRLDRTNPIIQDGGF
jgi:hypothetical protein